MNPSQAASPTGGPMSPTFNELQAMQMELSKLRLEEDAASNGGGTIASGSGPGMAGLGNLAGYMSPLGQLSPPAPINAPGNMSPVGGDSIVTGRLNFNSGGLASVPLPPGSALQQAVATLQQQGKPVDTSTLAAVYSPLLLHLTSPQSPPGGGAPIVLPGATMGPGLSVSSTALTSIGSIPLVNGRFPTLAEHRDFLNRMATMKQRNPIAFQQVKLPADAVPGPATVLHAGMRIESLQQSEDTRNIEARYNYQLNTNKTRQTPGSPSSVVAFSPPGKNNNNTSSASSRSPNILVGENGEPETRTTMMLRNIPNKYTQSGLLAIFDEQFAKQYDFFYLPIDFKNRCNVGYCFVNFTTPAHARRFLNTFHNFKLKAYNSPKVCEVNYARVQGLTANVQVYRNSPVNGIPIKQYRPLLFKDGQEIPFPGPDAALGPVAPSVM